MTWTGMLLAAAVLGAAVVAWWLTLVVAGYLLGRRGGGPSRGSATPAVLPDLLQLVRGLGTDPDLPRGVRLRLAGLVLYLALPIDLVPDFIPIVGYADDVVVAAVVLRSVVRAAGPQALDRHWRGSPEGLRIVMRLAGLESGHEASRP